MRHLLTPSLYNSWHYYNVLEDSQKSDFLDTLSKKPFEPNEAMQRGIKLENDVVAMSRGMVLDGENPDYEQCVKEIAEQLTGSLWQQKVMFDMTIRGQSFLMYGKADALKKNWCYDVKFTKNYEIGKFQKSIQHPVYLRGLCVPNFRYIISDGSNVWHEDYHNSQELQDEMESRVDEMVAGIFLDDDFRTSYTENWKAFDK